MRSVSAPPAWLVSCIITAAVSLTLIMRPGSCRDLGLVLALAEVKSDSVLVRLFTSCLRLSASEGIDALFRVIDLIDPARLCFPGVRCNSSVTLGEKFFLLFLIDTLLIGSLAPGRLVSVAFVFENCIP